LCARTANRFASGAPAAVWRGRNLCRGGIALKTILGMGMVWLAFGVLLLFPMALRSRNPLMKTALYEAGKVCLVTGFIGIVASGLLVAFS
jgi:hypothetical protein